MYSVVSEQAIIKFLSNYGIDYSLLTLSEQSIVVILGNILFLLFWSVVFYILYRVFARILDRWF